MSTGGDENKEFIDSNSRELDRGKSSVRSWLYPLEELLSFDDSESKTFADILGLGRSKTLDMKDLNDCMLRRHMKVILQHPKKDRVDDSYEKSQNVYWARARSYVTSQFCSMLTTFSTKYKTPSSFAAGAHLVETESKFPWDFCLSHAYALFHSKNLPVLDSIEEHPKEVATIVVCMYFHQILKNREYEFNKEIFFDSMQAKETSVKESSLGSAKDGATLNAE
jgi:hypothetical protein